MELATLRRAFRARPGTPPCNEFSAFLEGLATSEPAWRSLVSILEMDVIPVVRRCHPTAEPDEISSVCLTGAFESWVPEWLDAAHVAARVRRLLAEDRHEEALAALAGHPRFRGQRDETARALWSGKRPHDAVSLVEGTRSARSHFIARTRAQISESERKRWRQSLLMSRHCSDASGRVEGSVCGAELARFTRERSTWRISAVPPAHLPSQDLAERLRRLLDAIDELGPEHARVFKLLMDGLSQRRIAEIEGRDPAAISRRVRKLRKLCQAQLLD